jgi:HAD superfamily hydrolase (TIGR01509 family)
MNNHRLQRHLKDGRAYSAIIFDMDGLMLDTELVERIVWQRAAQEFNCSLSNQDYTLLVGRSEPTVRAILTELWGKRGENPQAFDSILALKKAYYQDYVAQNGIQVKDGLRDLLRWITEIKLPKAVASSSRRGLVIERLTMTRLIEAGFDAIVGGDEVEKGKPSPDIFLLAAQRLNTPANECVVLEDSDSGILAAHAAGMIPLMIPDSSVRLADPPPAILEKTHQRFSSLAEAHQFLTAES